MALLGTPAERAAYRQAVNGQHTQVHSDERACADIAAAAGAVLSWAAGAPVVFGGDLNVRDPGGVA